MPVYRALETGKARRCTAGFRKSLAAAMEASKAAEQSSGVADLAFLQPVVAFVFARWWTVVGVPEADDRPEPQ
jgi:hypothetical protein